MNWIKVGVKWGAGAILLVVLLGLIDLYTFELVVRDPGYYVVARRSDTPTQVLDALDHLKRSGGASPGEIEILVERYRRIAGDEASSSAERQRWERALRKARHLLSEKRNTAPP